MRHPSPETDYWEIDPEYGTPRLNITSPERDLLYPGERASDWDLQGWENQRSSRPFRPDHIVQPRHRSERSLSRQDEEEEAFDKEQRAKSDARDERLRQIQRSRKPIRESTQKGLQQLIKEELANILLELKKHANK
jgi:hypothetical protein